MVTPDYPLRTARLVLRPYAIGDLDDVHDIQSRPEVARYLLVGARDRDQVRAALEERILATLPDGEGGSLSLAVVLPETGTVIGEVVLFLRSREHRQGEIGYGAAVAGAAWREREWRDGSGGSGRGRSGCGSAGAEAGRRGLVTM
jgi:RimJ/RimL family protein N-acetyltransferase